MPTFEKKERDMRTATNELIEDLLSRTKLNLNTVEQFKSLPEKELNWKENTESWSVLECIEHLNLYGDFYLPEIRRSIVAGNTLAADGTEVWFKSGILGNYFAMSMLPKEGKLNKMKTFKDKDPAGSKLNKDALQRFTDQQKEMLDLLNKARKVDLTKVKTAISITRLLKLRLGDTLRVVIYHNQRHIVQAENVLKAKNKELIISGTN